MVAPRLPPIGSFLTCASLLFSSTAQAMPLAEALTHSLSLSSIPSVPRDIAQPLPSSPVVRVSNFTGPLLNETLGDLSILKAGGKYYAFASHSGLHGPGAFKNVPTAVSDSLTEGWQPGPDAMKNGVGSWTIDPKGPGAALWNPDVSQLDDGTFIMYYSAKGTHAGKSGHERCIGIAYSSTPLGPYNATSTPFYCPPAYGAIGLDGIKLDSKRYVLFKDGSNVPTGSHVALWEVDFKTGSKPQTDKPCLITKEDPKQPGFEGPALTKMDNGTYLLLHTDGVWDVNYTMHWATSETICGTYKEGGLLMGSGDTSGKSVVYRPGGPDFLGESNSRFFFFADPEREKSKERRMYYGELVYGNGGASVKMR